MSFEDFISNILYYYNQIAPQQNTQNKIKLNPETPIIIQHKIIDTLRAEQKALLNEIRIDKQMMKGQSNDSKIIEGVKKLSLEMIQQAKNENRVEILPGDFELALSALNWNIWPLCSASGKSNLSAGV